MNRRVEVSDGLAEEKEKVKEFAFLVLVLVALQLFHPNPNIKHGFSDKLFCLKRNRRKTGKVIVSANNI